MAHTEADPDRSTDPEATLSDDGLDTLADEVISQANTLAVDLEWSEYGAISGALDNVLDDAGYHVDGADTVERTALERAIRARLPLEHRATLGFSRGPCRFKQANPLPAE